ncbi:MAG: hypothetical protein U0414_38090 [Polyangiaceae bacterium]
MRLSSLLVALALSIGVAEPAWAAPPATQAKSKGKPKKPKPGKKKPAQGQSAKKPTAVEDAPVIRPLVAASEPASVRAIADSGLTLVASQRDDFASAGLVLRFSFGSADDPASQAGAGAVLLRALEHALGPEIRALRELGGDATFDLGPDAASVRIRVPSGAIDAALGLVSATFTRALSQADVDAAKATFPAPSVREGAEAQLVGLVYQGFFPYEHAVDGTAASRAPIDVAALEALRKDRVVPGQATLALVSPGDANAALDGLKARFTGPKVDGARPARAGTLQEQTNQRAADVETTGAPTTLLYAWAIRDASEAELNALSLAARLLTTRGAIDESVAKLSLPAQVHARLGRRAGASVFFVEVGLPDATPLKKARHAVEDVFVALSTKAAVALDLAHAREAEWVDALAGLDDPLASADRLAAGARPLGDAREALEAVTPENVRAAAAKYLGPLTRAVVQVSDPAKAPASKTPKKQEKH